MSATKDNTCIHISYIIRVLLCLAVALCVGSLFKQVNKMLALRADP